MSYKLVDLCFDIPGLSTAEKAVMMALCRHANNEDYTCFPSLEVVAEVSSLTLRSVQRILPTLADRKLVAVLSKGNGRGIKNKFQINVPLIRETIEKGDTVTPFEGDEEPASGKTNDDIVTPFDESKRVTLTTEKGDIHDIERVTLTPLYIRKNR